MAAQLMALLLFNLLISIVDHVHLHEFGLDSKLLQALPCTINIIYPELKSLIGPS